MAMVLLAAAGPMYRIGLPLAAAFAVLRWAAYAGIGAAALAFVAAAWASRTKTRAALVWAVVALVIGLGTAGLPYFWLRAAQARPPIHDITTDLLNPPTFSAIVPLRADAPNGLERTADVNELQQRAYPGLAPVTLPEPPGAVFDRVEQVAQGLEWEIVAADRTGGRLEATDRTRWFGFEDDVVVRLTPWGAGTRVDVRSVSRVGRGDTGTNARRIQRFLERLQAL